MEELFFCIQKIPLQHLEPTAHELVISAGLSAAGSISR